MLEQNNSLNNKRIAKNAILLYIRMIILMLISLYTSRVILDALGIEDYGINNVVAGFVSMFSIISASLTASISRFITIELGKGSQNQVNQTFCHSINVMIVLSGFIFVLMETIGLWFLNNKLIIPSDRLIAANWLYQFSILSFIMSLLCVPYNSLIVAHERMSAFAYIGAFDALAKLLVSFIIIYNPFDRLIYYAILLFLISNIQRLLYMFYCKRNFKESSYRFVYDIKSIRNILSFAGWNFFGQCSYILNTQGINMLMNMFFGVTINAARGIAVSVDAAIRQFVLNFMMAINPQITKSYANGNHQYMCSLIFMSAKYASYIMLLIAIPLVIETEYVLNVWLKEIPVYATIFTQYTIISIFFDLIFCNSIITAIHACGNIKKYQIIMTISSIVVFPITWFLYSLGYSPEISYIVFLLDFIFQIFIRLHLAKSLINLSPSDYFKNVFVRFFPVAVLSIIIPLFFHIKLEDGSIRFIVVTFFSITSVIINVFCIGLSRREREFCMNYIRKINIF